MDFTLSETQRLLKQTARELAERELAPRAAELDRTAAFPWGTVRLLGQTGFFGVPLPAAYGGGEAGVLASCLVVEELARGCMSTSSVVAAHFLAAWPIVLAGSAAQKERYLPPLARGEAIAAYAQTEPEAGSDVAALRASARRDGDAYVLNGTKRFITNGSVAGVCVVFAKTDPAAGHRGISAFVVEQGAPGFSVSRLEHKMGQRGVPTAELVFADCRVPADQRLGPEGSGFRLAMQTLDWSRPLIGAQAIGIGQAALDAATAYARQRTTFGKVIAEHQAVRMMLADMVTDLEAARLLDYRAAALIDAGAPRWTLEASISKLFAGEASRRIVNAAVQIHGGYGYVADFAVERYYRDQRVIELYEGTNEIQRLIIARELLGER
ncbi:MAG: acyl-CoA dehydrogenase family protein [Chloroflexi bacterium]|nr:acyl-CoA dehydrogenase family protein [Chloroflexota bacterium]